MAVNDNGDVVWYSKSTSESDFEVFLALKDADENDVPDVEEEPPDTNDSPNSSKQSAGSSGGCFIASLVYGSQI